LLVVELNARMYAHETPRSNASSARLKDPARRDCFYALMINSNRVTALRSKARNVNIKYLFMHAKTDLYYNERDV